MSKIFISYRRNDSKHLTGRIRDRLKEQFGDDQVFQDVNAIPFGVDWREYLDKAIAESEVFLAIIGKRWLRDPSKGKSLLANQLDHVCTEVECALKQGIFIIPVLVDGIEMLPAAKLTPSIKDLAYRQATKVRDDPDFDHDMGRLIDDLKIKFQHGKQQARQKKDAPFSIAEKGEDLSLDSSAASETETHKEDPSQEQLSKHQLFEPDMVLISKGPFIYGEHKEINTSETDYRIDVYPVTNEAYELFVEADGYSKPENWSEQGWQWKENNGIVMPFYHSEPIPPQPSCPVCALSYFEAEAYAKWAGKRLPTEQEWEKAARGTDGRSYPWGDKFDPQRCNHDVGFHKTSTDEAITIVSKYPSGRSPYGCFDMVGNVWEWCASWYDQRQRVIRGGSFTMQPSLVRCAYRQRLRPSAQYYGVGFRCVKDL